MQLDNSNSPLISSLMAVGVAVLGLLAVQILTRWFLRLLRATDSIPEERREQIDTLVQVLRWGIGVAIVGAALLMLMGTFGVPITPLLTGAGVAGLAVSLGAQTLIQDLIGGFLILLENQYSVGDVIQVGNVSGVVEQLTLRTTSIRDVDGRLHIVPNGDVRIVSNVTKDWSRALVDVGVAYEEDIDHALRVLEEVAETFAQDSELAPELLESPRVLGPISLGDWAMTIRVMVKTRPGKQWQIARALRKRILAACEREGVSLPYPRQEILVRHPEDTGGSL
jgi:small-conductance mechanosensitive channel